jgi:hypothetical protein
VNLVQPKRMQISSFTAFGLFSSLCLIISGVWGCPLAIRLGKKNIQKEHPDIWVVSYLDMCGFSPLVNRTRVVEVVAGRAVVNSNIATWRRLTSLIESGWRAG